MAKQTREQRLAKAKTARQIKKLLKDPQWGRDMSIMLGGPSITMREAVQRFRMTPDGVIAMVERFVERQERRTSKY